MADAAVSRIADRYANALYDVAEAGRALKEVHADVAFIERCCAVSPQLVRIIRSASIADPEKLKALLALLADHTSHTYTLNLLRTMAVHQRLVLLLAVLAAFGRVAEARAGIIVAEVTTALPLTPVQQEALDAALSRKLGAALRVVARTDPALLDGLTVQVGSRLYDASLRGKLRRLENRLKAVTF